MAKSIMQEDDNYCYLCGRYHPTEVHHICGASDRKNSEKYGLKVRLCHNCHNEPPNGVHHNKQVMDMLHKRGQKAFEEHYPDLKFTDIFKKNYL